MSHRQRFGRRFKPAGFRNPATVARLFFIISPGLWFFLSFGDRWPVVDGSECEHPDVGLPTSSVYDERFAFFHHADIARPLNPRYFARFIRFNVVDARHRSLLIPTDEAIPVDPVASAILRHEYIAATERLDWSHFISL